jgi:hypothetical protein
MFKPVKPFLKTTPCEQPLVLVHARAFSLHWPALNRRLPVREAAPNAMNHWSIICTRLQLFKQGLLIASALHVNAVSNDIDWGHMNWAQNVIRHQVRSVDGVACNSVICAYSVEM